MGGLSGHMNHPQDIKKFTKSDLKELVTESLSGFIKFTEKMDGMNIHATFINGEVRFLRNGGDLNNGGMTLEDMAAKWVNSPAVASTFLNAGKIIIDYMSKLKETSLTSDQHLLTVNCECINKGVTNIMPYRKAKVYMHNIWVWKKNEDDKYEKIDIIDVPMHWPDTDNMLRTPTLIFKSQPYAEGLVDYFCNKINNLFGQCETIEQLYQLEFLKIIESDFAWVLENEVGTKVLYNRFFNNDKSTNLKSLKAMYKGQENVLDNLCKNLYKDIVYDAKFRLDNLMIILGDVVLGCVCGYANDGWVDEPINYIKEALRDRSDVPNEQYIKWEYAGSKINPLEGVVFEFKGELLKITGSFAPINRIIGK